MILDDSEKTRIRERERAVYRIAQTVLALTIVAMLLFAVGLRVNANFMALWPLRDAEVAFRLAATDWNAEKGIPGDSGLAAFAHDALNWKPTPATARVKSIVAVDNPNLPGLRVFLKDSLLGSTPGLDTTRISYIVSSGGVRQEYYLPYTEQLLADSVRKSWFPWFIIVVDLAMMGILFSLHRWIKRLTGQSAGESI